MIYEDLNFSGSQPICEPGSTFNHCNLVQKEPHTKMFVGISGITINDCNTTNCNFPEDAIVTPPGKSLQIRWSVDADGNEISEVVE